MPPDAVVRPALPGDLAAMSALHDVVFGPGCFARTAYRIREGMPPISSLCLVSHMNGALVACVRFTPVRIGGSPGALLLGPLAVATAHAGKGYGKALVALGIERARETGRTLVLLVGNEPYYGRFGFVRIPHGQIRLPGPVDPDRLLAVETTPGALAGTRGIVSGDHASE